MAEHDRITCRSFPWPIVPVVLLYLYRGLIVLDSVVFVFMVLARVQRIRQPPYHASVRVSDILATTSTACISLGKILG